MTAEGSETVTLTLAADAAYTLGGSTSDTVTILDLPCDHWRFTEFGPDANNPAIAGPNADPDGDGLTNLEEYAYGTDPNVPDGGALVMDIVTIGLDDYLRLTVTRNPSATDVAFEVQATSDLENPLSWSSAGLIIELDTPTTLRVRDNLPMPTGSPRFMRLKLVK